MSDLACARIWDYSNPVCWVNAIPLGLIQISFTGLWPFYIKPISTVYGVSMCWVQVQARLSLRATEALIYQAAPFGVAPHRFLVDSSVSFYYSRIVQPSNIWFNALVNVSCFLFRIWNIFLHCNTLLELSILAWMSQTVLSLPLLVLYMLKPKLGHTFFPPSLLSQTELNIFGFG